MVLAIIACVAGGIGFTAWYFYAQNGTGADPFFTSGGRYDSSMLNGIGVIYTNRSDIHAFNEGYSTSVNCPWGTIHNGIDYFFNLSSPVIAATPGYVFDVQSQDWGSSTDNRYRFAVNIRFNASIVLIYGFEPWTNSTVLRDVAFALLLVKTGDWVVKGQLLGLFTACSASAHVHFGVLSNGNAVCPRLYFGTSDLADLMSLIHLYHSSWNLCYS
jgi:murein DD-endopeptidase MepM/ murein hydrolase activator NlpD